MFPVVLKQLHCDFWRRQKNIESRFYLELIKVLFKVTLMALAIWLNVALRPSEELLEDNYSTGKTDECRIT